MTAQEAKTIADKPAESQEKTQIAPIKEDSQPQETQEAVNWRKFREQRDIERKQKEESDRRASEKEAEAHALKAAMEAILSKKPTALTNVYENQYSNDQEETEEQRIDRLVNEKLDKRFKQQQEQTRQQEIAETPQKLMREFPDFNQMCSAQNLDYLEYHYPEIAAGYSRQPDDYTKWSNLYKAVKKYVPQTDMKRDQTKMENNLKKPGSLSNPATMNEPIAKSSSILSDDKKKQNWERMQKQLKGLS